MAIPYGFERMSNGVVRMIDLQIRVVQRIYQRYIDGATLGVIAAELEANQVIAPSGNPKWSRSVIDKMLSNGKYVPYAIPLSGLLVCAECGSNYRRITRPSGEVVWRCADRVEKGKQSTCKCSPTITDIGIKALVCRELELSEFDEKTVQKKLSQILIINSSKINIMYACNFSLQL